MVICRTLFGIKPRRQRASAPRIACGIQRDALAGQKRGFVAHDVPRVSALAGDVSTEAVLAAGRLLRSDGARFVGLLREHSGAGLNPVRRFWTDSRTVQPTPKSGARRAIGRDHAAQRGHG